MAVRFGFSETIDAPLFGKSYPDALMTAGTLFLWDARNSTGAFTAPPEHGAPVGNAGASTLRALVGQPDGTSSSLQGTFRRFRGDNPSAANDAVNFELTGKGGLHGAVSRQQRANGNANVFMLPAAAETYIDSQTPGHLIGVFLWARRTLPWVLTGYGLEGSVIDRSQDADHRFWIDNGADGPATGGGSGSGGALTPLQKTFVGPFHESLAAAQWSDGADRDGVLTQIGWRVNNNYQSFNDQKWPSMVFYRIHVVDLTVAGMTWGQFQALDYAEYRKQVELEGGAFFGDTWTDPAVLCP